MDIYLLLYWEFFKIGLFCIGGGYASMPWIQAAVVDNYNWLSLKEFIDIFTISQMTPGPIGINAATFAGTKIAGLPGSIIATLGFITPSFILCLLVTWLLKKYGDISAIKGILNGLRPGVIAFIFVAGLSFIYLSLWHTETLPTDIFSIDGRNLFILLVALVASKYKVGLITLLAGCGILGVLLSLFSSFIGG